MTKDAEKIHERLLLKKAIETGDADAVSELYKKYKPFLKKYLENLSHVNGCAEDLTHDIFLAISNHECKYSGDTDVQGYLCGIAKRLASNNNRKEVMQYMGLGSSLFEEIACVKSDEPLENLNIEEIRTLLFEVISKLPEKSRQAVELVLIHNLRPYQAAQKAGCSSAAFRGRLSCGLNIVRRKLINFSKKFEL